MESQERNQLNEEYILNRTTDTNYVYFGSRKKVLDLMKDGHRRTLKEIEMLTDIRPTTASSILRQFRYEKYGSHTVETYKSKDGTQYQLVINNEHSTDQ